MTLPLVAAAFDETRRFLHEYGCMPKMIGGSHLNRRIVTPSNFIERNDLDRTYAANKELNLDLPEDSIIFADKGYTDYDYEDLLEEADLHLKAHRKKNSKRPLLAWEEFLSKPIRQYIETVFSRLTNLFAKKIHAGRSKLELKIVCFLLAFSIQ